MPSYRINLTASFTAERKGDAGEVREDVKKMILGSGFKVKDFEIDLIPLGREAYIENILAEDPAPVRTVERKENKPKLPEPTVKKIVKKKTKIAKKPAKIVKKPAPKKQVVKRKKK